MTDRAGMILWYDAPHVLYLHTRLGIPSTLSGRHALLSLKRSVGSSVVCVCRGCMESLYAIRLGCFKGSHPAGQDIPSTAASSCVRLLFCFFFFFFSSLLCLRLVWTDGLRLLVVDGDVSPLSLSFFLSLWNRYLCSVSLLLLFNFSSLLLWPEWNWLVTEASIYTTIRHTPLYTTTTTTSSPTLLFFLYFCYWKILYSWRE